MRLSNQLLVLCMSLMLSLISCDNQRTAVFTTNPIDPPKCIKNLTPFPVEVTFYKNGVIDLSLDGTTYYLTWSDQINPGAAYLVNANNPAQTTQGGAKIPTTIAGGKASWLIYVVNGVPNFNYQLMAVDAPGWNRCKVIYSCYFWICQSGGFADPQFIGLQGQEYQVHGRPDTLFNLISYPSHGFTLNSEFVYLASGQCNYNNTECWTHPGTYFGKMGILIDNSTRVLVNSGPHQQGLQVYINDKRMKESDSGIELSKTSSIHVVDYDRVEIRTQDFFIALVNSDMFLNMGLSLLDKDLLTNGRTQILSYQEPDLQGLLGQTWKVKEYTSSTGVKRPYKGSTDDYIVDTPFEYMHSH